MESAVEIPVFPLPQMVFFPEAMYPLHVFEERYRDMLAYTLRRDAYVAMATLQEGWQNNYYGTPPVHPLVGVGKIVKHDLQVSGTSNILIKGLFRGTILKYTREEPFRVAWIKPEYGKTAANPIAQQMASKQLGNLAKQLIALQGHPDQVEHFFKILDSKPDLEQRTDWLASVLVSEFEFKQKLLNTLDPMKRAQMMMPVFSALSEQGPSVGFPRTGPGYN